MYKSIALLFVLPLLTGCPDESVIPIGDEIAPGVMIEALIDRRPIRRACGGTKVLGRMLIANVSESPISYSNVNLQLFIGPYVSKRTYVDSAASHIADSSRVEIPAGEMIGFQAYWLFSDSIPNLNHESEISFLYTGS